jgi:hypothetical protein
MSSPLRLPPCLYWTIHNQMEAGSILVQRKSCSHSLHIAGYLDREERQSHMEHGLYTQALKRMGGKWLIWHEHFSTPYDSHGEDHL